MQVNKVYHCIGVFMVTRCKHHKVKMRLQVLKQFHSMWSYIDSCCDCDSVGKGDWHFYHAVFDVCVLAVDHTLIEVENDEFTVFFCLRDVDDFGFVDFGYLVAEVDLSVGCGLDGVYEVGFY